MVVLHPAVRATHRLRRNYPQVPTFEFERLLYRVFVGCTFRCGPPGGQCWTAACDPGCVKTQKEIALAQQSNQKYRRDEYFMRLTNVMRINVAPKLPENSFYTAWVTSGGPALPSRWSAPEGTADENPKRWCIAAAVPDDIRMSAAPSHMILKSGSP